LTKRTSLFLKVTVEHDAGEAPEKIAGELGRTLLRVYGVLDVELSGVTALEE
jgi:hypothetical protein